MAVGPGGSGSGLVVGRPDGICDGCYVAVPERVSQLVMRAPSARYVDDVDEDPVVIMDGLTKNWRYPGWRTTWVVGPRSVIDAVTSSGSFLDGGGSRPPGRPGRIAPGPVGIRVAVPCPASGRTARTTAPTTRRCCF